MQLGQVETILNNHQPDLKTLGVRQLYVFGSVARDEAKAEGDIDFVVELDNYTLRNFMGLKFALEEWLGRPVDLTTFDSLKPLLKDEIAEDLQRVA
ncbi:MAG: nucleotidyltransferase family protein [Trueperaceae bacterium]